MGLYHLTVGISSLAMTVPQKIINNYNDLYNKDDIQESLTRLVSESTDSLDYTTRQTSAYGCQLINEIILTGMR